MSLLDNVRLAALPTGVLTAIEMLLSQVVGSVNESLLVSILISDLMAGKGAGEYLQAVLDQLDAVLPGAPDFEKRAVSLFLGWAIKHLAATAAA